MSVFGQSVSRFSGYQLADLFAEKPENRITEKP
ncbi:unnamed protein product, partial [marine sediment metagenome]